MLCFIFVLLKYKEWEQLRLIIQLNTYIFFKNLMNKMKIKVKQYYDYTINLNSDFKLIII